MSVEKDVEDELSEIFRRYGREGSVPPPLTLQITGNVAGRDLTQVNFHLSGSFDAEKVCTICREFRRLK